MPVPASVFTSVDLPTPDEPHERHRLACSTPGCKGARDVGVACVDAFGKQAGHELQRCFKVRTRVVDRVRLRDDDDGCHACLARQCEVPLQTRDVEVGVAGGDDEQRVDVGGDDLDTLRCARSAALEQARPFEDTLRNPRSGIDEKPVADGCLSLLLAVRDGGDAIWQCRPRDFELAAMDGEDACRHEAGVGVRELTLEVHGPAKSRKVRFIELHWSVSISGPCVAGRTTTRRPMGQRAKFLRSVETYAGAAPGNRS